MTAEIPLLYQDNWLVVCEKPAGLASQGESPEAMPARLTAQLRGMVFPVHRLDQGTAGLMVFACTQPAAAILSHSILENRLEKRYLALVSGSPSPLEGQMTDYLFKDSRSGKVYPVSRLRKGVREARLTYRALAALPNGGTLVAIRLETGRTHQIRVQFSSRKLPLWGDGKYGSRIKGPLALFSCLLAFPHPKTGETMTFFQLPDLSIEPWKKASSQLAALTAGDLLQF